MELPGSYPWQLGPHLQTLPLGLCRKHFGQVPCVRVFSFFCIFNIFCLFLKFFCVLLDPIPDLRLTDGDACLGPIWL